LSLQPLPVNVPDSPAVELFQLPPLIVPADVLIVAEIIAPVEAVPVNAPDPGTRLPVTVNKVLEGTLYPTPVTLLALSISNVIRPLSEPEY
jgi:hypothetical protein